MLNIDANEPALLPAGTPPLLMVVVDTEEDFDWTRTLSRDNVGVRSIASQHRAQEIFARHGIVPTYVVDYPVATDAESVATLRQFLDAGACEIGAHLHPWVNPPHSEDVTPWNSYPGNLPAALEREKLEILTDAIAQGFGSRPTVYKAGRYGVGPDTGALLEDMGYEVDVSVVPYTSFTADGGPDFTAFHHAPYWFGENRRLLEIPLTCGFAGAFANWGPGLYRKMAGPLGKRLRARGVAARLGVVERIRLTPEGVGLAALERLTRAVLGQGGKVFALTFHSPSLEPGNTPYVRDEEDLRRFVDTLDCYFEFFFRKIGGAATTPTRLYQMLRRR